MRDLFTYSDIVYFLNIGIILASKSKKAKQININTKIIVKNFTSVDMRDGAVLVLY